MPSICSNNIGFLVWSDVRTFEHLLKLLDIINDAFDVHPGQYSEKRPSAGFGKFFRKNRGNKMSANFPCLRWSSITALLIIPSLLQISQRNASGF